MYDSGYFFVNNPLNPLFDQRAEKLKSNRMAGRSLHPERIAGQGQEFELATCASGRFHPDAAHVLAQEKTLRSSMALEEVAGEESR